MATQYRNLCFLDQDGVLADFVGGACRVHGKANPFADGQNCGEFELMKIWNMDPEHFWWRIDLEGKDFWKSLEPTAEAEALVKLCVEVFGVDNVALLTAPSDDPGCVPGKRAWMRKHFPKLAKNMIYAGASTKHFLAGPGRFLIDDRDSNVEAFTGAGGTGILVPRPWNKLHGTGAVLETVRAALYDLAVQRVPLTAPGIVRHWPVAAKAKQGAGRQVPVVAGSDTTVRLRETPARGGFRGVSDDDRGLLCCAQCGTAFDSRKLHYCHPDAGTEGPA